MFSYKFPIVFPFLSLSLSYCQCLLHFGCFIVQRVWLDDMELSFEWLSIGYCLIFDRHKWEHMQLISTGTFYSIFQKREEFKSKLWGGHWKIFEARTLMMHVLCTIQSIIWRRNGFENFSLVEKRDGEGTICGLCDTF